jgi:PKD repeat protein
MKKITNNRIISTFMKRFFATMVLVIGLTAGAYAQALCHAAFTYTTGSSGQVNFTNTSTGITGTPVYQWSFGDNTTSAVTSPTHTYAYNGTYHVTLMIDSTGSGCTSSVTDSVVITNAATCSLSAAYTYTAGSGGLVNFTNTSTGTAGGMIYSWTWHSATNYSSSGSGSSSLQSPAITFAYNGTYNVTMNVSDPTNTCSSSVTHTVVVTSGQPCQVSFTYTAGASGLVSFTNTSQGNSTYHWNFGDGASSTQQSPTHTYAYNGTYVISLTADTGTGACGGTKTDSVIITNTQNMPTCTAAFTYTTGAGGQVSFTNHSTGTVASPSYSWAFGDGGSSTVSSPSYTYTYNGNYNVTLNEKDTMGNIICSATHMITVTTGSTSTGCHDSAYFYMHKDTTALSTWDVYLATNNSTSPLSVTWYWGDGSSSTGLSPTHTYAAPGWYNICIRATFACGDSSYYCQNDSVYRSSSSMVNMVVINTTGTTGIKTITNTLNAVNIYPNPFSDNLTIGLNSVTGSAVTYAISDLYGNVLATEKVSLSRGENKINLNTGNISSGVYFITIIDMSNKTTKTIKVVK